MLSKLLKYDLKPILKTALVFGLPILACTLLFNFTSYDYVEIQHEAGYITLEPGAPTITQFLHTLFYSGTAILSLALILLMILTVWKNFRHSFYSDAAYLTHTLPVSRRALWTSQFLTALIASSLIMLILTLACTILQATPGGRDLASYFGWRHHAPFAYYPTYLINILANLSLVMTGGLVGIVLGESMRRYRTAFSVIWCIIILLGTNIITELISELWAGLTRQDYVNFLGITYPTQSFNSISYTINSIIGLLLISSATLTIFYWLGNRRLEHGINLE